MENGGYAKHLAEQSDGLKKSHRDKLRHIEQRKQEDKEEEDFALSDVTSDSDDDEARAANSVDEVPFGQVLPGDVVPVPAEVPDVPEIDPESGLPFRFGLTLDTC